MNTEDDDWQEMPVVRESSAHASSSSLSSSSGESSDEGRRKRTGVSSSARRSAAAKHAYSARHAYKHGRTNSGQINVSAATNATGRHLDIDDARGYSWRAKPGTIDEADRTKMASLKALEKEKRRNRRKAAAAKDKHGAGGEGLSESSTSSDDSDDDGDEGDDDGAKGYTQLRLDDDPDQENLNAATDYLFTGGGAGAASSGDMMNHIDGDSGATPHSQLNTTKNLLSEGQKIAYVGIVSLAAKKLVRDLERVPGKELKAAVASAHEWRLRVMARLYQHMDIENREQSMIDSLAEHGVLLSDLAPNLITTQTIDNPDFDPIALEEREEEEKLKREMEVEENEVRQRKELERQAEQQQQQQQHDDDDDDDDDADRKQVGQQPKDEGPRSITELDPEDGDGDLGTLGEYAPSPSHHQSQNADNNIVDDRHTSSETNTPKANMATLTAEEAQAGQLRTHTEHGADDSDDIANALDGDSATKVEEIATLVDPNTAVRLDAAEDPADIDAAKVSPMGLTSQPQAIDTLPSALDGVTTELSSADKTITLDLRWTVLCDLFLVLTADSVYDARSRVLLERIAEELELTWMDVTKFEKRVTDALEIEEGVAGSLKGKKAVRKRAEMARKRRMVMMGLATVGGGLLIGLSAGLMAPLIGAGLGAALGTIGVGGTTGFLSGVGGITIITTTGTAAGAALGGTGMSRRTRQVKTFELKPIHNNKRVNCIIAVPGFMNGPLDDPRLPFSVVDSIMGDIFSLLWEPDMMQEMGNAIYLLWNETLVQGVQQLLAATIAGGLVGALAWPLWLTKLGYFIDNPWSNALDRAHACGLILADVLAKRKVGVRPITLVGFSLGARVIFYALVELARTKKFGIVQNVYIIGAPVTANDKVWKEARSAVAGRFVNVYSRTDWILGWLFRATSAGLGSVAGLRPVEKVPDVDNVDVTQTVPGHLQYRAFMPLVLAQIGFRTTAEYFDEPEDLENIPEREVLYDTSGEDRKLKTVKTKSGGFGKIFRSKDGMSDSGTETPSNSGSRRPSTYEVDEDDEGLPPREDESIVSQASSGNGVKNEAMERRSADERRSNAPSPTSPLIGMDETERILAELRENGIEVRELESSLPPLVARASAKPMVRQGSKLRHSVSFEKGEDEEVATPREELHAPPMTVPSVSVSSFDDVRGASHRKQNDVHDTDQRLTRSNPNTPPKPYARPFSATTFDGNGLPPNAPSISQAADVSLSFGDAYEEHGNDSVSSTGEVDEAPFTQAGKQYGLSAEAARELAAQFHSAGMSNAGAVAAAKIASNFEAMQVQTPLERQGSMMGSAATDNVGDPWGIAGGGAQDAAAPKLQRFASSMSARTASGSSEDSDGKGGVKVPPTSHAWGNSSNDNPWG